MHTIPETIESWGKFKLIKKQIQWNQPKKRSNLSYWTHRQIVHKVVIKMLTLQYLPKNFLTKFNIRIHMIIGMVHLSSHKAP